jgi:hypothetical protein
MREEEEKEEEEKKKKKNITKEREFLTNQKRECEIYMRHR